MKKVWKKIRRNSMLLLLMFALCGMGIRVALSNADSYNPEALPTVAQTNGKDIVFILDAGHGGMDGGCSSAEGVPEKGINLNIMLALRDWLEAFGYRVEVTRDTDRSIHDQGIEGIANQKSSDMDNRLALFNKYDNAVCISIHQNQFTDTKYSGAQMFYANTNCESERLAQSLQTQFHEQLQPQNNREIKLCGSELFLCYYCENPTVMVECGFLSNPDEAALLTTEEYQYKVAFTIFSGIQGWLTKR
ncbi:MAG: N-acetylmuramoyl-L-alanine amidase [Oscillospiraceae bacterium]|nr:N-acetylmuramoyl-L-alanine amidase [Oscillospiraceae bacterium]